MTDDTQDALLDATFRAIVDFGFEKATTKRIAAYAGVNEVTIFRKFGNKATLFQEAIRREMDAFQTHIHYTGDLQADLEAIVAGYGALVRRRGRFLPALFSEVTRKPELQPLLQKPLETFGLVVGVVARYQAEGQLLKEPPPLAVAALMMPVLAVNLASLFAPSAFPAFDARSHVSAYLAGRRAERSDHERH